MKSIFIFFVFEALKNRKVHNAEGFELIFLWAALLVSTLGPLVSVVFFLVTRHVRRIRQARRFRKPYLRYMHRVNRV